jgi:dihydroorotase
MPASAPLWLQQVQLLIGPDDTPAEADVLINPDGSLHSLGAEASRCAGELGLRPRPARGWWLGPSLVDPHSVLEQPLLGRAETLQSLAASAARGGYGQVALLPWGEPPRDRPEHLALAWPEPQRLHRWGSLCRGSGQGELAAHAEQLEAGALGLAAAAELPPTPLLQRALQLGEMGSSPLLLAPRQRSLSAGGLVRERVEALRAGWPLDPVSSEALPLELLLHLQQQHRERRLVLMNLSTAEAVTALQRCPRPPLATVHWWHLLADSGSLAISANGWRLEPPLGGPGDRQALIEALAAGVISAVAVHHQALDAEEQLLPLDQRRPGLAGHGVVLPLLWQALVVKGGWSAKALWQALCWGPCSLLGLPPEVLAPGSRRWLLLDPAANWRWQAAGQPSRAANHPLAEGASISGRVRASGLLPSREWQLD